MKIKVLECCWGGACRADIQFLLQDVASHIARELRHPFDDTVLVMNLPNEDNPKAFYRRQGQSAYEVNLTAKGRKWSQFSYQFAHEFCHILAGHEQLNGNPNNWLHETICELASIFVLRRMAERWRSSPPFPHWKGYSEPLAEYIEAVVEKYRAISPANSFDAWLSSNEDRMRADSTVRDKNGVVALRLLPLFEEVPEGWNAVPRLPTSTGRIAEYIEAWKASACEVDRGFLERIRIALLDG
ncbi:MAG: hypothetical protein OXN84_21285 [Albidovulum sp.]|nr:hypothetical protein [Albidovulum sp.]MDE0531177.1 hypothetical protein [Albidovulum sp.]